MGDMAQDPITGGAAVPAQRPAAGRSTARISTSGSSAQEARVSPKVGRGSIRNGVPVAPHPHRKSRQDWLDTYEPRQLDLDIWFRIRAFVLAIAIQLGFQEWSGSNARDLRALVYFVAWYAETVGKAVDVEQVFHPDAVEAYGRHARENYPKGTLNTYMSALRRMGPAVTKTAPWGPPRERLVRPPRLAPYATSEIQWWWNQSFTQTDFRKRSLQAALALGAGAGLDGGAAPWVLADDVFRKDGITYVRAFSPDRIVPVLAAWEDILLDLAEGAGDEFVMGGRKVLDYNRASRMMQEIRMTDNTKVEHRLVLFRLRSSWLVQHLTLGTRLPELLIAAGVKTPQVLGDLVQYVEPLDGTERDRILRGPV